jgi:bifunctional non-homologous end joining protein LigD
MLAALDEAPLVSDRLVYEPKYDGIRTIVTVDARSGAPEIRLWSRVGNDKTAQFPDLVHHLRDLSRRLPASVVLDGEIVALDAAGEPAGFQRLQGRIHLTGERAVAAHAVRQPVALVLFDLLRDGDENLMDLPLIERRARLERMFSGAAHGAVRLSEFVPGDGRELYRRAAARGWEGLVAKSLDSRYLAGRRSTEWRKLKLLRRRECVVGGWTEPRGSRAHFGALLLGVWEAGALEYVGHTGTGFDGAELDRLARRLEQRGSPTCPFRTRPPANERPHWVLPDLVVEVAFTEWTDDRRLRHPKYLGVREDVRPEDVVREVPPDSRRALDRKSMRSGMSVRAGGPRTGPPDPPAAGDRAAGDRAAGDRAAGDRAAGDRAAGNRAAGDRAAGDRAAGHRAAGKRAAGNRAAGNRVSQDVPAVSPDLRPIMEQLVEIEGRGGDGTITLPDGIRLEVGSLAKVFWPAAGITKGELMRYYVWASPYILPVLADRPLVMRRFPNGVEGKSFYQQRAPDSVPAGVRVARLPGDAGVPSRLIGGSLASLLHSTQLAAVSQDPWLSRVPNLDFADHVVLDLDPMPGVPFTAVLDVARWVHDELERLGTPSMAKTSGAEGLHIYIPLPARTAFETGRLFCEIIATIVADGHPRVATVERAVKARGRTVYIDYLQNLRGKTVAAAYSARATPPAGVSAPLTWQEVHAGVDRRDFTIRTLPARMRAVGDLWARLRRSPGADLGAVLKAR